MEPFKLKIKKPLRKYEAVIIFHPDCKPKELQDFFKSQRKTIQQLSGSFYNIDSWGKRRMIHPIKKLNLGIYFHTLFETKAEAITELERTMKINEKVLRFMHVQLDPKISLEKHLEKYRDVIALSKEKEQEREARKQKRFGNPKLNYQKNSDSSNSPSYTNPHLLLDKNTSPDKNTKNLDSHSNSPSQRKNLHKKDSPMNDLDQNQNNDSKDQKNNSKESKK